MDGARRPRAVVLTALPLRQSFTLNVRTNPGPSAGMGGQIFGRQDGQLKGPFPISGP
jgi:hypothetical protein